MKIVKILLLLLWLVCTVIFILGALTPLEFTHKIILYVTFIIAFNGIFVLGYLLTNFISVKINRLLIAFIATIILVLTYEFYIPIGSGWETRNILYRQKDDLNNVIVFQTNDNGPMGKDHRTVKIIQVTPLFSLTNELKMVEVNNQWIEVKESVNAQ